MERVYTTSLTGLPKITFADVTRVVEENSVTKRNKLDKGYTFFHEEFIHNIQGPFPNPDLMAAGAKLHEVQPQLLTALVLDGLSEIELTPSKFGPVPRGSPMSYHCPPETSSDVTLHHLAPEFPALPLPLDRAFSSLSFVPTLHQQLHLQSLQVSPQMASEIEKGTRQQSRCPAWAQFVNRA
ncbi:hypothetical protein ROHU_028671 [Labeo rohita]|uniref:Uncharacterized protein n=1 Tax=Labeo rohita TaxID=84645 RepID=A0A498M4Q0_LABRO|nr:hypothetical protein ROHU_028671 [Labeo rohita]